MNEMVRGPYQLNGAIVLKEDDMVEVEICVTGSLW